MKWFQQKQVAPKDATCFSFSILERLSFILAVVQLLESNTHGSAGSILHQEAVELTTGRNVLSTASLVGVANNVVEQHTAGSIGHETNRSAEAVNIEIHAAHVVILAIQSHKLRSCTLNLRHITQQGIVVDEAAGINRFSLSSHHLVAVVRTIIQLRRGISPNNRQLLSIHSRGLVLVSVVNHETRTQTSNSLASILSSAIYAVSVAHSVHPSLGSNQNSNVLALKVRQSGTNHGTSDSSLVISGELRSSNAIQLSLNIIHTTVSSGLGNLEDTKAKTNQNSQSNQHDTQLSNSRDFVFHFKLPTFNKKYLLYFYRPQRSLPKNFVSFFFNFKINIPYFQRIVIGLIPIFYKIL